MGGFAQYARHAAAASGWILMQNMANCRPTVLRKRFLRIRKIKFNIRNKKLSYRLETGRQQRISL